MIIARSQLELKNILENQPFKDKIIGFVPTMGALHAGHISLILTSKKQADVSICSIFVNPTQFNNPEDYNKYPITIVNDISLLEAAACDILFLPSVSDMYPEGLEEAKKNIYDIDGLDNQLEGEFRPGHFQGVCMIVHRLLTATQPNHLFMGAKDYQQCMVVKKLIDKLQLPIVLHACPTLRAQNGLALSSRNQRLTESGREIAKIIYENLNYCKANQNNITFAEAKIHCDNALAALGLEPEYLILAQAHSLAILPDFRKNEPMVVLVAAWLEGVRLIDNMVI
jgi:pantoate--beta-alanine ligase